MVESLKRVRLLAWETLIEAVVFNRWLHVSVWGLLVFILGGRFLMELPLGSSAPKLLFDLGLGLISGVGGVVLIVLLVHHCFHEIESGSVQVCLVRQTRRWEYLMGKLFGCWLAVILVVGLADGLLAVLVHYEIGESTAVGEVVTGPRISGWFQLFLFQLLQLLVLAALAICMVSLSTSFLFAALTTLLLWGTALLLRSAGSMSGELEGLGGFMLGIARLLFPRFEVWNVAGEVWYAGVVSSLDLGQSLGVAFLYLVCFSGLGVYFFNQRDL